MYNPTSEVSDPLKSRTDPCIALRSSGNANGSWIFWNLKSDKRVVRTNWIKLKTDHLIIDAMIAMSKMAKAKPDQAQDDFEEPEEETQIGIKDENLEEVDNTYLQESPPHGSMISKEEDAPNSGVSAPDEEAVVRDNDAPEQQEEVIQDMDIESDTHDYEEEWDVVPPSRKSARLKAGVKPPARYENYSFHLSLHKGLKTHGKEAYAAFAKEELIQLWREKKTMIPVKKEQLTKQQKSKTIRPLIFLKEKYDLKKIKARLVANGAQQDRNLYDLTSSPTVAMQSIMMGLTIAAREKREIAVAEIKGAYLNADMTEEVHMELEPMLTKMIINISPEAKEFVDDKGRLTVRLEKALYGCVQSVRLWYNTFSGFLETIGFKKNETDKCVMNRMVNGKQLTVMIYVDDLLITCESQEAIQELTEQLRLEYGEIKLQQERDMSYLGMHLISDTRNGKVNLSMKTYIENVLQEYPVEKSVSTPANNNLFSSPAHDKKLDEDDRKKFHSVLSQLLAKRTRPEILLAVSYLCTKVREACKTVGFLSIMSLKSHSFWSYSLLMYLMLWTVLFTSTGRCHSKSLLVKNFICRVYSILFFSVCMGTR